MLLDMLTADAAAKHGHEYSPPHRAPSPSRHGSFFAHMPLSLLSNVLRRQTPSPAPTDASTDNLELPADSHDATATKPTSRMTTTASTPAVSPSTSRPPSSCSNASAEDKPRKRAPRPKTIYNLAQPPPIAGPRQKLHIRPKVLLQLHQVIPSHRPKPVYEVIPFTLLAPRSSRRLAGTFNSKGRDRLGPSDLLIVKAEQYGSRNEEEKSDDERWGARDVIGIICPGKEEKGNALKTEVLMDDGSCWEVTCMPNGGYEFNFTDEHGLNLKSRWVPKGVHNRRVSSMSSASQASPISPPDEKKFTFSTISASSRRHPIIATMTRTNIDVLDSYAIPNATSPPTPSLSSTLTTPMATPPSITDLASFIDKPKERLPVRTDDALRRFIVVSGIWVAFSENWSPAYSSSKIACPSPLSTSTTFRPTAPHRTVSMSMMDSPRSTSPASTIDENRRIPRLFRSSTQLLYRNSSFTSTSPSVSSKTTPASSPTVKTRSRRSNSTGNADLSSKTGSTKKRFGLALENEALPETEEERQSKRSIELLRIKDLALPGPASAVPSSPTKAPMPIRIIEPPEETRTPSPSSPDPRGRKTMSAYNPVDTAGLWDSGVIDGPGAKRRPTSLVVVNEKLEKAKRKQEREKSREKNKEAKERDLRRKSERFKQRFIGIFRREKGLA